MAGRRRYVIAAGTARYEHLGGDRQLPSVVDDVALVAGLFTGLGYERVLPQLGDSPTAHEMESGLGRWLAAGERTPDDILVVYYSGHGESVDDDAQYLVFRDTEFNERGPLPHTALPDDGLARLFAATRIQHALVVLDTCYAGRGITGFSAKAGALLRKRAWDDSTPHGIYLVAASRPREKAAEHAFARAFVEAVSNRAGRLGGRTQRYLEPGPIVGAVNALFARDGMRQRAVWMPATVLSSDVSELIPNPIFESGRAPGLDLEDHWLPKARGGEPGAEAWYFSGRERALRELVPWLAAPPDGRARVVTGGPGTGKSALLGRLVALADPTQRARIEAAGRLADAPPDTIPASAAIDAAVHAHGKTLDGVVAEITGSLGIAARDAAALVRSLGARNRPATIVIDALDEAAEPRRIALELVRELAPLATVRLLVGTRAERPRGGASRRVPSVGTAATELDLDDPAYAAPGDVAAYVERRLLAEDEPARPTPYRGRPELARIVARGVAARAGLVYLVARIVSRTLADAAAPVDTTEAGWEKRLPADAADAFDAFLDRFDAAPGGELGRRAVVDLLRPLAFAEGEGLPRDDVWAPLAAAIAGRDYGDDDVATMLRAAGAYVVEGSAQGRSAYRLYHELLAEHLRRDVPAAAVHGRIVDALVAGTPTERDGGRRDWRRAHPYAVAHLGTHAARAGRLDEFLVDPLFLAVAEPRRLLPVLPQAGEDARRFARVFELASHQLDGRDPAERLAYLELAAEQHGGRRFLATSAALALARPWRAEWANWAAATTHRVLALHDEARYAYVTVAQANGESLVLVAAAQAAGVYRLDDGTCLFRVRARREALSGFFGPLAVASVGGEAVVLGWHSRCWLRMWRLADGAEIADWSLREIRECDALAIVELADGPAVVVAGSRDLPTPGAKAATIEIWAIGESGPQFIRSIAQPSPIAGLTGLTAIAYRDRSAVFAGYVDGSIRIWDRGFEELVLAIDTGHAPASRMAAAATPGGGLAVALARDELIRMLNIAADGSWTDPAPRAGHADGVIALALGEIAGQTVCVSTGRDNMVCIWRFADASVLGKTLIAFAGITPTGLAVTTAQGEPVVVTGDSQGTVRVWPYRARPDIAEAEHFAGYIEVMHELRDASAVRLVTCDRQRKMRLWDASDGRRLDATWLPDEAPFAFTAGTLGDRPVVVMIDEALVLRARFADSGAMCGRAVALDHLVRGVPIAFCGWRGRPYAAVVLREDEIHLYDLKSGKAAGFSHVGHGRDAFVLVPSPNGPLAVTYGLWHILTAWPLTREAQAVERPLAVRPDDRWATIAAACTLRGRPVVAAWHFDQVLCVYDVETRTEICDPIPVRDVTSIVVVEHGGELLLASGTHRGEIRIWRAGEPRLAVDAGCALHALALLPPDRIALAASEGLMVIRSSTPF